MEKTLTLLAAALALAACVRQEPELSTDTREGNFEALWTIIDRRYCFLDYKGVDWDSVGAVYRPIAANAPTTGQLFDVLCQMLATLRDGHVNLSYAADFGHYWAWKEDHPDNFDTELQEAYLGRDYKIAGSLKYRFLDDNTAYVVCNSFSEGFGNGNLDYVFATLMPATGMIVDVRDNPGGSLDNARLLASRFTNERRLVGYTLFKTGPGHGDFSDPLPEYIEPQGRYRWQKSAVVLTNRSCYSATNTFVRDMRACPHVTVVGDTTGGGSGLPMNAELPNGWSVRYSSAPMLDADMRHIEFGIAPDVVCGLDTALARRGVDTMVETARRLIKSKNIR